MTLRIFRNFLPRLDGRRVWPFFESGSISGTSRILQGMVCITPSGVRQCFETKWKVEEAVQALFLVETDQLSALSSVGLGFGAPVTQRFLKGGNFLQNAVRGFRGAAAGAGSFKVETILKNMLASLGVDERGCICCF